MRGSGVAIFVVFVVFASGVAVFAVPAVVMVETRVRPGVFVGGRKPSRRRRRGRGKSDKREARTIRPRRGTAGKGDHEAREAVQRH